MEILKFDNAATPRRKKSNGNLKSLAGLASVAAIAVLGSTLAANISLGTSGIEFGQGVQTTAACDSAIDVTPSVRFINASGAGTFYLSTIALSSIDFSSTTACRGKTFTLNAYNNSDATPLQLATGADSTTQVTQATFAVAASGVAAGSYGVSFSTSGTTGSTGSVTLGFGTPTSTSGAVYKITLQSQ
jgi:hypothetical protein